MLIVTWIRNFTESKHFPQKNPVGPDVRLCREDAIRQRLNGHPFDWHHSLIKMQKLNHFITQICKNLGTPGLIFYNFLCNTFFWPVRNRPLWQLRCRPAKHSGRPNRREGPITNLKK